jgi:hypothetical protein
VRVQDVLGAIQDCTVMDQRLRGLSQAGRELPATSVFILGQLTQCYADRAAAMRGDVDAALDGISPKRWRRLKRRFSTAKPASGE